MALFQEKQTDTTQEIEQMQNPITKTFANEFNTIYNQRTKEIEKRKEEESLYLQNLISKDKINEWQSQGKMTAIEVWNKKNKHELLPYAGTISQGNRTFKLKSISDKLRNGQTVTPEERKQFDDFLLDMAEVQARGYSFGGGAVNLGLETLPYVVEFGLGLLTTGGVGSLGSTTTKVGAKATIKGVQKQIAKTLAEKSGLEITGDILKGAGKVAYNASLNPRTYAFSATRLPQQVYARMGDVMLSDSLAVSEEGQVILKEAETKPATAFLKSLALTNIEVASEMSGDILVRPALHGLERVIGLRALKQLGKTKLPENFVKLAEDVTKMPFAKAVDKLGFNGILEEIGEERVGDLLKVSFNLDDEKGYSYEQFLDAMFASPEQLAQEFVAFGLTGVGMNAVNKGLQKASENYTKDGFLLDAGIFRVAGRDSLLDQKIKSTLQSQGVSEEDIENVLQFSSKEDKVEFLKNGTIDQEKIQEQAQKVSDIKNKYYTQNLNAGIEDVEALQSAEFISQVIASTANNFDMSIEDADKAFNINIQSMTDQEAIAQRNKDEAIAKHQMFNQSVEKAGAETEPEIASAQKEWKEKGTESKYFKKWFGDSKVVDKNGKPLIVYHGTKAEFNTFDINKAGESNSKASVGFWFTGTEKFAKNFASDIWYGDSDKAIVMPVYLALKNPKVYQKRVVSQEEWERANEKVKELENKTKEVQEEYRRIIYETNSFAKANEYKKSTEYIFKDLKTAEAELAELKYSDPYYQFRTDIHKIDGGNAETANTGGLGMALKNSDSVSKYVEQLKSEGYDGIIIKDTEVDSDSAEEKTNTQYVAFYPEQIKSVNNQGTFDSNKGNIYFQPAYHGTPHKFDEFSTEKIGTGEGNQAHGWGLYFAENKNVSEAYRDTLANVEYKYDGKRLFFTDNINIAVIKKILKNGKEKYAKELKQQLDETIQKQKEYENNEDDLLGIFWDTKSYYRGEIERIKERLNFVENFDKSKLETLGDQGQLYKVDIPEIEEMLDENKNFLEQSKKVQKAIKKLVKDNHFQEFIYTETKQDFLNKVKKVAGVKGVKIANEIIDAELSDVQEDIYKAWDKWDELEGKLKIDRNKFDMNDVYRMLRGKDYTGRNLYNDITKLTGSPMDASLLLNKYGVKGITYDGRQDGRCYVVFDDKAVNVLKTYYQNADNQDANIENSRGFTYERTNFDGTAKENLVVLLKGKANKSTLLHEFAHVYLTTLNNLARTNDKAKEMLIKVNKFLRYNGKEYTVQQHERFADYFVAYVRTGKAPTYGLKKVFENFRKWLNDLYSSLQLSDDIELSKEATDLFDELLGNMTLKAQKEISEEIVKKAKNNALLKYQEDNAQKRNIPTNQLTERQRRYRDTAYDILWYAISHSKSGKEFVKDKKQLYMLLGNDHKANKKNMGVMKQSERLFELLSELDDEFSANDGFLPEWGEFFHDPNVEEGYDAELALQALDVIQNRKYLYDYEDMYQELSDEDVKIADLELDYILEEYSNEQGDKTNIVCAFFDWIDEKHPYIQEDLISKWELKTNEIDRYQSLSKFQQAKEDMKIYASKLKGYGDYSQQFAEYARAILKRLDFMTERDKEKIFSKLKEYNSFRDIERNLDYVMDYAETLQDVTDRRKIADDIQKEVKQTIHEWKDGIKKTKYTYPANKLFERLRKINNMKQEEIEELYDELVNDETSPSYVADEVNDETFYETLERMFVEYKHNGMYYNSTEFLTNLLEKIQSAKFTAKVARDEKDFELQMQKINLIDECARAVEEHKKTDNKSKLVDVAQNFNAHIMNFNGALKMIFNDSIKNQFSLDYLYAKKDGFVGRDRKEVLDKLRDVFQFKTEAQLFSKMIDMTKQEFEIRQRFTPDIENGTIHTSDIFDKETGQTKATVTQIMPENQRRSEWEPETVKLSRMELIYYYIQAKNPISYKMLTDMGDETTAPKGQFDKFEFDSLLDELTPQEKLMGDILQVSAEKYYDGLNAYHIKKYHTDLGKVMCYFPRLSEVEDPKMLDVFNDYVMYNGKDSSQKHRTAYAGIRIKPANALAVLFNHIEKANTIIVMGEQLDLMNKVFNNSNLKRKIENTFGNDITQSFYQHVTANLYSGQSMYRSLMEDFFNKLSNNAVKTQLFFKPQIGLKQLLSFMNYGKGDEYVSAGEWLKAFSKQTFTPAEWKKNIDFMMSNEYLKDRYSRGGSTDALKRQLENRMFSKLSLLDDFWGLPIRLGDIGAIILGGKPYIDVLMSKGYTKEQAFKIFIETTVNDQQSSIPSTLSNAQRNAKNQPFAKLFFAYQNTPWQYLRSAYTPIVTALQKGGQKNITHAGKMLFIYGWLFPAIFNMASSLSIFALMGGDDDQFNKDMIYAFMGLFGMFPVTGDLLNSLVHGFCGEKSSGGSLFDTATNRLNKLARHIQKESVTIEDFWNCIVSIGELTTGQPLGSMSNAVSGAYDVTQGDVAKGALKVLGYSDYRAKTITGEK